MKKVLFTTAVLGFIGCIGTAQAQDEKITITDKKKGTQEIIIRSKSDKDSKIVVEVKGDKVTINGKPLSEFKDDNISISKRNITIYDQNRNDYGTIAGEYLNESKFWNDKEGVSRAFLGVTTDDVEDGAKITEVTKESAAEKAGLMAGDIITKIGDTKIDGPESLLKTITSMKPKDEVTVYYKRDGKENQSKAILGERKEPGSMFYSFSAPDGSLRSITVPGIPRVPYMKSMPRGRTLGDNNLKELEMLSPGFDNGFEAYGDLFSRHQKLGLKIQDTEDGNGVKILEVEKDSPAEKAGLKKDDILTEVGGKKLKNTDETREILRDNQDKSAYNIKANRNGNEMSFDIRIPKKLKTANL